MDAATKDIENDQNTKMLQEKQKTNGKAKILNMDKEVSNGVVGTTYHMNSAECPYSYAKYSCYQVL